MAMTAKELRAKSDIDLTKLLLERRKQLGSFRFAVAGGKTKNVREGRMVRRQIAAILTVMGERK
ncbi:MAG: 50S ribosomal protein L29 [Candidatus Vogelbacteria bacterium]|nr:50S ribosomal protein L29 [Candidatus Vogelbacteria bacterium]